MRHGKSLLVPHLKSIRDYWLDRRGRRRMPARSDLDPCDVPTLIPYFLLTDVTYDPLSFRYRLIGTQITQISGRDATGRTIDEDLYGEKAERVKRAYLQVVASREPVAVREIAQFVRKDWLRIEALLLPLGETDEQVTMILSSVGVLEKSEARFTDDTRIELDWRR
jgi:hypothetical protein